MKIEITEQNDQLLDHISKQLDDINTMIDNINKTLKGE